MGRGKRGLRAALAAEKSAEIARLAAEAARALGCEAGLEAAETVIRAGMLKLGGGMLGQLLAADPGHRGPRVPCGQGHDAEFVSYRDKVIDTVLGPVTLTRAWYHCAACGHGFAPRDAELGVAGTSMSPGLTAMNDRAAAAGPFAKAAGLLQDLAGIRLTAKRVERAAEASGAAQAAAVRGRAALITDQKVVPLPPSPLPDKLYGVIDGTGVPMTARETAGREGKGEDGRARTREVKLAVFFTQDKVDDEGFPIRDRGSSSYIAIFEPAAVFGGLVKAEGTRRGADYVRQLTILGDGAAWIWNIATAKFPGATQIVDLFHAREHLNDLASWSSCSWTARTTGWRQDLRISITATSTASAKPPASIPSRALRKTSWTRPSATSRTTRPARATSGPPVRPVHRLRRRRSRLQVSHRPAPQAIRHALDHRRRRRHHRSALPGGQQPVGSHLQHPAHSDTNRLTSPAPR